MNKHISVTAVTCRLACETYLNLARALSVDQSETNCVLSKYVSSCHELILNQQALE